MPIRALIAVVMVLGGALWVQYRPLTGLRPPGTESQKAVLAEVQDVEAHLWEDPFTALSRHLRAHSDAAPPGPSPAPVAQGPHTPEWLGCQLTSDTVVLAAMVFGGSYAERVEHRRRARYALLAGLNVSGFVPVSEGYVGYIELSHAARPGTPGVEPPRRPKAATPFEWFQHERTRRSIVVLWLDELALRHRPLSRLDDLVRSLSACTQPSARLGPRLAVIGPAASTTLAAMLEELSADSPAETGLANLDGTLFYSGTATAPATLLLPSEPKLEEEALRGRFRTAGITFLRTTATDDRVITTLRGELCRRGLDSCATSSKPTHHVALVSEWDTLYGRALPKAVGQGFCKGSESCPTAHHFSYLRGLDGILPGDAPPRSSEARKKDDQAAPRDVSTDQLERAEGNSQFDYLRRLVQRVQDRHWELQRERSARISAIGVLGSDPYDKLLVLQALRDHFPGVLFFTTDLDARFLNPTDTRRTRNLVVASAFGLALRPELQQSVAPFRDSYQTGVFLATRLALRTMVEDATRDQVAKSVHQWTTQPRLFEIGRTAALDLSPRKPAPVDGSADPPAGHDGIAEASTHDRNAGDPAARCVAAEWLDCPGVHPAPYSLAARLPTPRPWAIVATLGLAMMLAYASSWTVRHWVDAARTRPPWLLVAAALAAPIVAYVLRLAYEEDGEPAAFLEG
jgi:hypothetical protein